MGFKEGFSKFLTGVAFTGAMGGADKAEANPFAGLDAAAEAHRQHENEEGQRFQENRGLPPLVTHPTIEEFQQLSIITEGNNIFFENEDGRKVQVLDQLDTELELDDTGNYAVEINGTKYSEGIQFIETENGFILTAGEYVVDATSGSPERITREEQEARRNQNIDFTASL